MNEKFNITNISRVILVGENEYRQSEVIFTHDLACNELIFHLSGKSVVYFNGKKLKTAPDTIRFLPKGENRQYIVNKEENGECIDVFFDTDTPVSCDAFVMNPQKSTKIKNLFKKLFASWVAKNDGYYFECVSILYKIFSEMQKSEYISADQYRRIEPALEYIDEHFRYGKISVAHLAEMCSVSESYLKQIFNRKFGMPPARYIIQLRINYACDLLSSQLYNISQTAGMCGYADVYYFSHQFKEVMGCSPSTFVNRYKSSK